MSGSPADCFRNNWPVPSQDVLHSTALEATCGALDVLDKKKRVPVLFHADDPPFGRCLALV